LTKAVELFERSALLDNTNAMYNLAVMYEHGTHPEGKNPAKVDELLDKINKLNHKDRPR